MPGYTDNYYEAKPDLSLTVDQFAASVVSDGYDYGAASTGSAAPSSAYGVPIQDTASQQQWELERHVESLGQMPEDETTRWRRLITEARPRSLQPQYKKFEADDSRHRMGDWLETCFDVFSRGGPQGKEFYPWLDEMPEWERVVMLRGELERKSGRDVMLKPSEVKAFVRGVAYLDRSGRKRYRLKIRPGGLIEQAGRLFDTSSMSTVFSGRGHAIWVLGPQGQFYANSHVYGQFHHSSFLSGSPIRCGGELVVRGGVLKFLSGKSGHYRPEKEHFRAALAQLALAGVNLQGVKVLVWAGLTSAPMVRGAREFLESPGPLSVWGRGKHDCSWHE